MSGSHARFLPTPTENWRDVPGYEGLYQASDHGRVRSLCREESRVSVSGKPFTILRQGRVLRPCTKPTGYVYVVLGKGNYHSVHRLVAFAFLGTPDDPRMQVNHKNGDRSDNRPSNLEWVTCSDNHRHAFHVLGRKHGKHPRAQLVVLTKPGIEPMKFESASLAAVAVGATPGAISGAALRGHKCRGYSVEYVV